MPRVSTPRLLQRETVRAPDGATARIHTHAYNRTGEPVRMSLVGGPALELSYDGFGTIRTVRAADGTVLRYARDPRGLIRGTALNGPEATGGPSRLLARRHLELDERGNPRRIVDELFDDPAGPVTDVVTAVWHDDAGRPERIDEAGGLVRTRRYGPTGALAAESDSLGNAAVSVVDRAGRTVRTEYTTPVGGVASTSALDPELRLQRPGHLRRGPARQHDPVRVRREGTAAHRHQRARRGPHRHLRRTRRGDRLGDRRDDHGIPA
ncbi:hypothetical protein [Streptomyces xiangluensis]|uniref:hypothetical protein n=1 Tax=Streptomyces xiangluensis TaxID=2665720 RepID=UPI003AA9DB0B